MNDALAGRKAWFIWNVVAFGKQTPADRIVRLCEQTGATAVAIKVYDGTYRYQRDDATPELFAALQSAGLAVGVWGYHYGHGLAGEMAQLHTAIQAMRADFAILNVEDPAIERNPRTPTDWAWALAEVTRKHPNLSMYFCSHAQPRFHERQPYYQAMRAGLIQQPMIYHTAMQRDPVDAVEVAIGQYRDYGLLSPAEDGTVPPWSAAGAAYGVPNYPILPIDVATWAGAAVEHGATSLIWWDLDVAQSDPQLLRAIAAIDAPAV